MSSTLAIWVNKLDGAIDACTLKFVVHLVKLCRLSLLSQIRLVALSKSQRPNSTNCQWLLPQIPTPFPSRLPTRPPPHSLISGHYNCEPNRTLPFCRRKSFSVSLSRHNSAPPSSAAWTTGAYQPSQADNEAPLPPMQGAAGIYAKLIVRESCDWGGRVPPPSSPLPPAGTFPQRNIERSPPRDSRPGQIGCRVVRSCPAAQARNVRIDRYSILSRHLIAPHPSHPSTTEKKKK